MANPSEFADSVSGPPRFAAEVTPNDGADLANVSRAILVGVAGDVKVTTLGGSTITLPALAAGVMHPICARRIWSTDTTATDIVSLY